MCLPDKNADSDLPFCHTLLLLSGICHALTLYTCSVYMNMCAPYTMCAAPGGLPLLLAALDKDRGAAIGALVVLEHLVLVGGSDPVFPEFDTQICSLLLQMGAVERLSQLLQPLIANEDAVTAEQPGETPATLLHFLVGSL